MIHPLEEQNSWWFLQSRLADVGQMFESDSSSHGKVMLVCSMKGSAVFFLKKNELIFLVQVDFP